MSRRRSVWGRKATHNRPLVSDRFPICPSQARSQTTQTAALIGHHKRNAFLLGRTHLHELTCSTDKNRTRADSMDRFIRCPMESGLGRRKTTLIELHRKTSMGALSLSLTCKCHARELYKQVDRFGRIGRINVATQRLRNDASNNSNNNKNDTQTQLQTKHKFNPLLTRA